MPENDEFERYRPADVVSAELTDRKIRYMLHIVAYDICDPNRLRKVANICLDYGARVEKSVFECDLPPEQFDEMWAKLMNLMDDDADALVAYRICAACAEKVTSLGSVVRPGKRLAYMI